MNTPTITIQLPPELLQQVQAIAPTPEALQQFLVQAIAHELDRTKDSQTGFWDSVEEFREKYNVAAADINPDEIFANVRDRSPGREVTL
jgi:hypothetical protein